MKQRDPISLHISIPSTLPPLHAVVRWIICALASLRPHGWPNWTLPSACWPACNRYISRGESSTPSTFLNSQQSMSYLAKHPLSEFSTFSLKWGESAPRTWNKQTLIISTPHGKLLQTVSSRLHSWVNQAIIRDPNFGIEDDQRARRKVLTNLSLLWTTDYHLGPKLWELFQTDQRQYWGW